MNGIVAHHAAAASALRRLARTAAIALVVLASLLVLSVEEVDCGGDEVLAPTRTEP